MPSTVIIETFDAFLVAEPRGRGTVWFYADGLLGPFFVSPVVYEPWTGLVDWCDLLLDGQDADARLPNVPSLTWLRAEHDGPDGLVIDIIDLVNEAWPIERGESVVRFRVNKRAVLGAVLHQLVKLRDGFEGKTANAAAFPFDALAKVLAKRERSRARLGRGG